MTLYVGIDPGKKGALGIINDRSQILGRWKMPTIGNEIDAIKLWQIFQEIRLMSVQLDEPFIIGIEKPFTMPSDVVDIVGKIQELRDAFEDNDPEFDFDIALTRLEMGVRKRDGRVGVLAYGTGFGLILGQIGVLGARFLKLAPRTWQSAMWIGIDKKQKSKQKSFQAAKRIWPAETFIWPGCRVFDDGVVDCLLIAEYVRMKLKVGDNCGK